jgi:phenylalanine-4-hydroxylase
MICGSKVTSVFGGAADRQRYLDATGGFQQEIAQQKTNLTDENRELNQLYSQVRKIRDASKTEIDKRALTEIFNSLEKSYKDDWLLRYELLELCTELTLEMPWEAILRKNLQEIAKESSEKAETIQRGLDLL